MHIILDRIRCAVTRLSIINTSSHYTSYTHHKHSLKFDGHQDMHAQWSRIAWSGVEYNAAKDDLPERCSSCIKNIDDDDDGDEHNSGKLSFGYILLSSTHANSPWNTLHFHSFKSTMCTVLTRPLVLSSIGMIVYLYIFLFY